MSISKYLCRYLSIYVSIYVSVYLAVHLSTIHYLSIRLPIIYLYLPIHHVSSVYIYISICHVCMCLLSIYLLFIIYLFIPLSTYRLPTIHIYHLPLSIMN